MYRCRHFDIEELVPPETLQGLGEAKCWWLFDQDGLKTLDALREAFDRPLVINDWKWGGLLRYSGFRPPSCTEGAEFSQHRFGRAFDVKVEGKQSLELSDQLRAHIRQFRHRYTWIRCLETDITWCHIDGRNHDQFLEFAP